jgi:hypothetical protein
LPVSAVSRNRAELVHHRPKLSALEPSQVPGRALRFALLDEPLAEQRYDLGASSGAIGRELDDQ